MSLYFFDTSGLAKRYISEVGSAWVIKTCARASGNRILIAEITAVEIISAMVRRRRGGSLTSEAAQAALSKFEADLLSLFFVSEISSARLLEAQHFARTYGLRSLDAIQLAVAVNLNHEQIAIEAARSEGLFVENPNNHR